MFEQLQQFLDGNTVLIGRIIWSILIVLGLWFGRRLLLRFIDGFSDDPELIYTWRKVTEFLSLVIGGLFLTNLWLNADGIRSASTYLGLLSAGIAIALQDPLVNFIGWLFLITRRPFEVGDRIEIGDVAGDVIDVRFFQFSLQEIGQWVSAEQSTGRTLHVPNRLVFKQPVANYTSGVPFIWNEIPITVTFESNWRAAKNLLEEIAANFTLEPSQAEQAQIRKMAKQANIRFPKLTPVVYTEVEESGVILTLRYLCKPRQRRNSKQKIWEAVLDAFAARNDVDFAYPTRRFFSHQSEGKTLVNDHSEVANPRSPRAD